jgi:hypothetical protein
MTATDRKQFLEIVIGFAELKGKVLSAVALELYWRSMQDWDLADFQLAANHLLRTCTFMPTPKDFEDLRKSGRDTASESWDRAVKHASSSAYRWGPLGDARIDMLVRGLGGYSAIAMCDESKLQFLERRFCDNFDNVQNADDVRKTIPQITSHLEDLSKLVTERTVKPALRRSTETDPRVAG